MDFSYLNAISDGDEEFIKEFVSTFETNNNSILAEMQVGLNSGDFDKLGKLAHQLKPTIEMLGMKETLVLVSRINNEPSSASQEDLDFVQNKSLEALEALKSEFNIS
ncbi:MAG: Hpt domain-containing protein [Cyclobacteriaceae bacterium]